MGEIRLPLQILCFFLFILISSPVHSRKIEKAPKPSLLDVAASIRRSNEILSFNPDTLQQQQQVQKQTNSSSSSFTVKLYSRDILSASKFKSYRDLALSRIERDAVRVNFLYKKLNIALGRNMTSDISQLDVSVPITSARSNGIGAYVAQFGIGTPPQTFYTLVDTGSDVTWVHCNKRANPVFDPSSSSSYKSLQCNSPPCNELRRQGCDSATNTCLYQVLYGKGSSTGEFATETLTLGCSAMYEIAIGCDYENDPNFDGVAGLFGLGRGSLSFPSQTKMSSFSYCLVDIDSTAASTLDFGSLVIPNEAITTPLLGGNSVDDEFYFVGLTGISVAGKMLPLQPSVFDGGVIVDSGTTLTLLPTEVYNVFRDEFVKGTKGFEPITGIMSTCFNLTSRTSDVVPFPPVAFHFGTKTLSLPAKSTVILVGENIFCLAFVSSGEPLSILGNVLQQEMLVSFDVGNSLIGFTPNKC